MKRIKQQQDDAVHDDSSNKKRKFQNKITIINRNISCLEDLANEIFYEIFEYLDIYYVYQAFFDLNKRFQNLFLNSNLPLQVSILTMSKSNFEHYHQNIIISNRHRINYLRLSNPFIVDIVLSPPRIISRFVRLESLVLDNIDAKYLNNILNHLIQLPEFYSLTINLMNDIANSTDFYLQIFRLPKLKYCKLKFQSKNNLNSSSTSTNVFSPIEHLVIKNCFPFESFNNLLSYLPRLHHLSIDGLVDCHQIEVPLSPIELKCFKYVSLKLDFVNFNRFEQLVRKFFSCIEVLRITTRYDPAFLDAKRWEQLILSSMPNLRIFDINHDGLVRNNSLTYHDLISQFNSSFWIDKQWFFIHQHDWQERLDSGIFYSTDPYRRTDYTLYWQTNELICSLIRENNLNSVKHVRLGGTQTKNTYVNYFPNATKLTIKQYFKISADSIATILNRMIPLEQLTELIFDYHDFPCEQFIELLSFTPNLHTVKYYLTFLNKTNLKLIQNTDIFQYVSTRNKIKTLELPNEWCTLEQFQMIVYLFPQLEYLKIRMNKKTIEQIIRFLFTNMNSKSRHLFFLCISRTPKRYLQKLNMLIKSKHLLDNYVIKFVNRDLYLWW